MALIALELVAQGEKVHAQLVELAAADEAAAKSESTIDKLETDVKQLAED